MTLFETDPSSFELEAPEKAKREPALEAVLAFPNSRDPPAVGSLATVSLVLAPPKIDGISSLLVVVTMEARLEVALGEAPNTKGLGAVDSVIALTGCEP